MLSGSVRRERSSQPGDDGDILACLQLFFMGDLTKRPSSFLSRNQQDEEDTVHGHVRVTLVDESVHAQENHTGRNQVRRRGVCVGGGGGASCLRARPGSPLDEGPAHCVTPV